MEPMVVMVHEISSFTRTMVVRPVVWPTQESADDWSGMDPRTTNENGLPTSTVVPPASFSVTSKAGTCVELAVSTKVNCVPPPMLTRVGVPVAPAVVYVGGMKSDVRATAVPNASITLIVQEMTSLMCTYVVDPLTWPMQDRADAPVAAVTRKEKGLLTMGAVPAFSFSVTYSVVTTDVQAVRINVKLEPPFNELNADNPVAPVVVKVGVLKSPTTAAA